MSRVARAQETDPKKSAEVRRHKARASERSLRCGISIVERRSPPRPREAVARAHYIVQGWASPFTYRGYWRPLAGRATGGCGPPFARRGALDMVPAAKPNPPSRSPPSGGRGKPAGETP